MQSRIETLIEKKLIGKKLLMSFANNQTFKLWNGFMSRRTEIKNNIGTNLYSMQIYPPLFFEKFNPNIEFEKWACVEVKDFISVPTEMESFILPGGLYAVFLYKGIAADAETAFRYILQEWLPKSNYVLDNRPHLKYWEKNTVGIVLTLKKRFGFLQNPKISFGCMTIIM